MANKEKLIVIGNGMVGHKFLESLVDMDQAQNYEITVLCEEPRAAYDRVYLTSYFSGKTAQDLSLVTEGFFETNNIDLKLNCQATELDRVLRQGYPCHRFFPVCTTGTRPRT